MEFYDSIPQVLPLWDHDVANEVVEVVLHEARHSQTLQQLKCFSLRLGSMRFKGEAFKTFMNFITVLIDLGIGSPHVEVAEVKIHGIV